MAETYGELICRLCQLRDQLKQTEAGRAALERVKIEVCWMLILDVSWETALEMDRRKEKEMQLENKDFEAMAAWTLEDLQEMAVEAPTLLLSTVRELAASHMVLQRERDAAVRDMKEYGAGYGFTCEVCGHKRGTKGNPCFYPANVDVDDKMCRACDKCPCGHCDGVSQWEWRGMQMEELA